MGDRAENLKNHQDRIVRDPKVCRGEPVFKARASLCGLCSPAWLRVIPPKRFSPTSQA